jgi:hypothetical protein
MADALGSISAGPLSISEGQNYTDNISSATDVDYFKLPASLFAVPSRIDVSLGGSFSSVNDLFSISIVNSSDTVLQTVSTGVPTSLSASAAAGSSYYLKVAQADSLDTTNYTISYDVVETAESELRSTSVSNGSIQSSNHLIEDTSFKGALSTADDTDWYTFTTGNVDGSTVTLSLSSVATDATFYNLKITDENGTTVSKTGNEALSTTAGTSSGSLSFTVAAGTPTESGTYFVNVEANNTETFASSSEFGNQYTLSLSGNTDYNAAPVATINGVSSGDYGTTVENDNVYSTVSRATTTALSDIISVSDADTASTPNSTISQYIIGLQDTTSKTFAIAAESGNANWLIDGKADPTLTLIRGQTYTFDRTDSGHSLQIQADASAGTVGTAYGSSEGITAGAGGDFTYTVASTAPSTLYYQCAASGHEGMGGVINIVDNLGTVTYTDDTEGASTITAKTSSSGSGFLTSLSAAEFASASYVSASGNDDNQKIYAIAVDNSGISSVDTNASTDGTQGLTSPNDTSGIITYRFVTSNSGISISGSDSDSLIEGTSSTNQTLTAALIGTPAANVNVNMIIDAPDDITISGSNISVVDASANTYVMTLNSTTTSDTFTVSAANSVNSGTATLQYSTVSTDSAYNALSIPSTEFTVEENIATFTVSDITYSSSSDYVSEGSTTTGTYTITANGLSSNDDLELIVDASGLEFSSATSFNLTQSSPSATIVVTADDDTTIEAGSNNDGIHSHAVTHAINENGSVSSTYLNSISNKSISVADNDDTSSAKSVSISDASSTSSTITSIPDNITVNLIDSSGASTSFTSSSGAILAASDLTISHVALVDQASVYTSDVAISDVVLQLRDIVGLQTLTAAAKEAADVNNDGEVAISDVVSSLRHIVGLEEISTFDLIDSSGSGVTQVGPSMSDANLTLVQNGDVDLSGSFTSIIA